MKLSMAAKYFNRTKFYDAYSGLELGAGQLDIYDDSKRDGITAQRRVFEVAPGTALPPRLAIQFHGLNWLVGVTEIDSFHGDVIREKHVLHQAEELAKVATLKQTLNGTAPYEAYAARVWVKSTSEVEISSAKYNQLQIFFSKAESLSPNTLIELGGKLHTVMAVYPASAGHQAAMVEELDPGAVEIGTLTTLGEWDRVKEIYPTVSTPLKVVKLRWQSDFVYYSQATENFQRGDMQAACITDLENGTTIGLKDGDWTVVSAQSRNEVYYLHLRRA